MAYRCCYDSDDDDDLPFNSHAGVFRCHDAFSSDEESEDHDSDDGTSDADHDDDSANETSDADDSDADDSNEEETGEDAPPNEPPSWQNRRNQLVNMLLDPKHDIHLLTARTKKEQCEKIWMKYAQEFDQAMVVGSMSRYLLKLKKGELRSAPGGKLLWRSMGCSTQ